MPSWGDIQEYARLNYDVSDDTAESFSIVMELEGGRSQKVSIRAYAAVDTDWVEFRSYVCKEADLAPRDALRKNADLPVGALALDEHGDYFVSYAAAMETLDPEEFDVPLNLLVLLADALEEQIAGTDHH